MDNNAMSKDVAWTVVPKSDAQGAAYQARTLACVRGQLPGSKPAVANALGPWHYVAEHGDEGARKLAEADGAASGLPQEGVNTDYVED